MRHRRIPSSIASLLVLFGLVLAGPGSGVRAGAGFRATNNGTLTVFAAASLTEAFTTIGAGFGKANGVSVKLNFAGSDALVTQMAQGAPADVFASANQAQMTLAASKGLIASTPSVFARNRLVVIVPKNNPAHIYSLPDLARPGVDLVLAAPTVPVGNYARAAFKVMASDAAFGSDFLQRIQANIKSNEIDVKAVTAKVSLGEADAGVVYVTDVTPSVGPHVQMIAVPPPFNQIAVYPIAVTKTSGNAALAQRFIDYVESPTGKRVLAGRGFITTPPAGGPSTSLTVSGLVATPTRLTVADLRKLPSVTVRVTLRTEAGLQGTYSYTGPLLYTVVEKAGLIPNSSFTDDLLRQFVTVGATDDEQVTVGMAEITPTFGHQQIILAYLRNGRPLAAQEGEIRLIVPGDSLAGRWVPNVDTVVVGTPVGTPS